MKNCRQILLFITVLFFISVQAQKFKRYKSEYFMCNTLEQSYIDSPYYTSYYWYDDKGRDTLKIRYTRYDTIRVRRIYDSKNRITEIQNMKFKIYLNNWIPFKSDTFLYSVNNDSCMTISKRYNYYNKSVSVGYLLRLINKSGKDSAEVYGRYDSAHNYIPNQRNVFSYTPSGRLYKIEHFHHFKSPKIFEPKKRWVLEFNSLGDSVRYFYEEFDTLKNKYITLKIDSYFYDTTILVKGHYLMVKLKRYSENFFTKLMKLNSTFSYSYDSEIRLYKINGSINYVYDIYGNIIRNFSYGDFNMLGVEANYYTHSGVGITDEQIENLEMKFYPNPAIFTLHIYTPDASAKNYSVYDVCGRKILQGNMDTLTGNIDISALQTGVYYLSVSSGKTNYTKKFYKL